MKSLEALERIAQEKAIHNGLEIKNYTKFSKEFDIIEKELLALDVIKAKAVDVWWFINRVVIRGKTYKEMLEDGSISQTDLTREDYKLLKEVLSE